MLLPVAGPPPPPPPLDERSFRDPPRLPLALLPPPAGTEEGALPPVAAAAAPAPLPTFDNGNSSLIEAIAGGGLSTLPFPFPPLPVVVVIIEEEAWFAEDLEEVETAATSADLASESSRYPVLTNVSERCIPRSDVTDGIDCDC